jgi:23S rRNA (cytidine1920-2'-O)/16S rRNA (cytidine1409-2'-O)-methyltransferase
MKKRLDVLLAERGLAESRQKAQALVLAGLVFVDGRRAEKPGSLVAPDAQVQLKRPPQYVGRGALKLKAAAERFGVSFQGKVAMDVGASTGGFTDFMLKRGAKRVYAVDVGWGQLHQRLRRDPRVVVLERRNIRHLRRSEVPEAVEMATVDVSFISLRKVLPPVVQFLAPGAEVLALVKPQFELSPREVQKGGVVKDEHKRLQAVELVKEAAQGLGLRVLGTMPCPVAGQKKGNVEYFVYLRKEE